MKQAFAVLAAVAAIVLASDAEESWQTTLRAELDTAVRSNRTCFIPFVSVAVYFSVPAEAAKILESRSKEELLPFLTQLRADSDRFGSGIADERVRTAWIHTAQRMVDDWIRVVRRGLRGKPSAITETTTMTNSVTSTKREIQIYQYSYPLHDTDTGQTKP